jgi:hypothetical protein
MYGIWQWVLEIVERFYFTFVVLQSVVCGELKLILTCVLVGGFSPAILLTLRNK